MSHKQINQIKRVYLLGIGGIGMSGLARYFNHKGCLVAGYDRTESPLTKELAREGMEVIYEDETSLIPTPFRQWDAHTLIIYTPAIPADSSLLHFFQTLGFELYKRAAVLGLISEDHFTIAVAGTHGKTTTSSMVAHILQHSGYACSAFLGGIATNFQSNVLFADDSRTMVVEADEFDRSFLSLHPNVGIVTSTDADHLDIYGDHAHLLESFRLFLSQIAPDGERIIKKGLDLQGTVSYAVEQPADVYADHIRIEEGVFVFDLIDRGQVIPGWRMGIPGRHNIENAVAAIIAARRLDIAYPSIQEALESFAGVKRRFEFIVRSNNQVYIDDYAHHPEELKACFSAVRQLYPNRRLTVLFQPHLFSRTRDFLEDFAAVLAMADDVLLLPIYPAREQPIPGVTSELLLEKVPIKQGHKHLFEKEQAIAYIRDQKPALLVSVGAGDIDRLVPKLKEVLTDPREGGMAV